MSRSVSSNQLAMFMPAHEIAKMKLGDTRKGETNEQVLARKLKSAKEDAWEGSKGMYESIKKIGVQEPVELVHSKKESFLGEGHHRLASAMDVNPNMLLPVSHHYLTAIRPDGSKEHI